MAAHPPGRLLPTHSPDGVDLTLIRWMLSLTPAERLQALQSTLRSIEELRHAWARARSARDPLLPPPAVPQPGDLRHVVPPVPGVERQQVVHRQRAHLRMHHLPPKIALAHAPQQVPPAFV